MGIWYDIIIDHPGNEFDTLKEMCLYYGVVVSMFRNRRIPTRRERTVKKGILFICIVMLFVSLILPGASAGAVPVEFTGKTARYDMTAEEYAAWAETAFNSNWWNGRKLLANFPLLTESVTKLFEEVRNNSSAIWKDEGYVYWRTDALKAAYEERMLGVSIRVEFGSEDRKLDIDATKSALWHDGTLLISLPAGYAFEDISALRIDYDTWSWPNDWGHAWFHLTYDVSGGRVICRRIDTEMDDGRFIVCWWMGRNEESDEMYLSGMFYDLAFDKEFSQGFDPMTGKCID